MTATPPRIVVWDSVGSYIRSILAIGIGVMLLLPIGTATTPGYRVLNEWGTHELWGALAILVGILKILGESAGPRWLLIPGSFFWAFLATSFGLARPEGTAWLIYTSLFAMSVHHYVRSVHGRRR